MDGTEDDMLWEDDTSSSKDEETEIDEDAADPFDDRNSKEQFNKLFGQSDDSDEVFWRIFNVVKLLDVYNYMF